MLNKMNLGVSTGSLNKLLTHLCAILFIYFFATNSERIEQLRRKVLIITAQMKRALHPHFRQKTQKNLTTLEKAT